MITSWNHSYNPIFNFYTQLERMKERVRTTSIDPRRITQLKRFGRDKDLYKEGTVDGPWKNGRDVNSEGLDRTEK